MKSLPKKRKARMGALPARYSLVLNPYVDARFTKCPRCKAKTRVRKIPLVIRVDGAGLVAIRKTCRLCVNCEMLIVHQAELESLISASVGQAIAAKPDYLVLGTVDPRVWRRGLSDGVPLGEMIQHMADFKAHLKVEYAWGGCDRPT